MKSKNNTVRLTESKLRRIIAESVKSALNEMSSLNNLSDRDLFNEINSILRNANLDAYVLMGYSSDNKIIVSLAKNVNVEDVNNCLSQYGMKCVGETSGGYPYDRNCYIYNR